MARSSTRLVLICGLPASGKTTLARQLAPEIPAIRLDKDEWTTQLGFDVWDDELRGRIEAQLWALAQELLARGQSVILEWGHWARAERDEKRLVARAMGVEVELRYLTAPVEELIERAERRSASGEWTASPMTRAHFETWALAFQPPDDQELLLFDQPAAAPRGVPHRRGGGPLPCGDASAGPTLPPSSPGPRARDHRPRRRVRRLR